MTSERISVHLETDDLADEALDRARVEHRLSTGYCK
jgi:hypothetical protein